MKKAKKIKKTWLLKTEPDAFSFDDLIACPQNTDSWDGIRNYQARNILRDEFVLGDRILIYHSRIKEPAIIGIGEVVREAYPDHTALDSNCKYYDPKSAELGKSRWVMVDVKALARFDEPITRNAMKEREELKEIMVLRKGSRLSIQPVSENHWQFISSHWKFRPIKV